MWLPRSAHACRGTFLSGPNSENGSFPYAALGEVAVDRRHVSVREFRKANPDTKHFVRLVLYTV